MPCNHFAIVAFTFSGTWTSGTSLIKRHFFLLPIIVVASVKIVTGRDSPSRVMPLKARLFHHMRQCCMLTGCLSSRLAHSAPVEVSQMSCRMRATASAAAGGDESSRRWRLAAGMHTRSASSLSGVGGPSTEQASSGIASFVQSRLWPGLPSGTSCAWGDSLSLGTFGRGVMLTVQAASSWMYCSDVTPAAALSSTVSPRKYLSLSLHAFQESGICPTHFVDLHLRCKAQSSHRDGAVDRRLLRTSSHTQWHLLQR